MHSNSASFFSSNWPVLTRYDKDHLRRIALPLGGIGTGTVSLGGRGDLRDFEIVNRPAKTFSPLNTFFAINLQKPDGTSITRALEGAISPHDYEGDTGCRLPNHSLPRFRECAFEAAYPFGQVLLSDADVPVSVRLQGFNPLVPANSDDSGLPLAVLRYQVTNNGAENLKVSIAGTLQNFIGVDGTNGTSKGNFNEFRRAENFAGVFGQSNGVDKNAEQWGTLALGVLGAEDQEVSHRTSWAKLTWGDALLDFWDDFSDDGVLEARARDGQDAPHMSLASSLEIAPGETKSVTFVLAWHFPNRMNWAGATQAEAPAEASAESGAATSCCGGETSCGDANLVGNFYTTQFSDAWDVLEKTVPRLSALERSTLAFVRAFCESDLPAEVLESALYNLSTLRSQTCFRTPDGHFFAWEGCADKVGCCQGSCTHVWNYEQALAFMFGDLSRSMREVEFFHAMCENGLISFRVDLPLERGVLSGLAAADGQSGCAMKLYRDWKMSGDDEWLAKLWPNAKKSIEFNWIPGGWDADGDGVMEGCQHNTMDVEYFGPNPQMQGWYLGALRAGEEMAEYLGDSEFSAKCRELFEKGSRWTDENLFNGDYYEHEIRPISNPADIAPGLIVGLGPDEVKTIADPQLQLGAGCLIDQLVGQYMAHVCGLGYLLNEDNVHATLQSVLRFNWRDNFHGHFNHLRSYVLGDESAVLMASYPRGRRPARPFPYYNEVMTGFEHTLAAHMIYEGDVPDALKVIAAIRERYDGKKRSPFDEAECGHHYGRALASWAHVLALTGFEYSGVTKNLKFAAATENANWFWSNGNAWGTISQIPDAEKIEGKLRVEGGVLALQRLELREFGMQEFAENHVLQAGEEIEFSIEI